MKDRLGRLLLCLAIAMTGARAQAQGITTFVPGAKLLGSIDAEGEADPWVFGAVAGSEFSLTVKGQGGLLPTLSLRDRTTDLVVDLDGYLKGTGSKLLKLKKLPMSSTGTYELVVSGSTATQGGYMVRTKLIVPKALAMASGPAEALDEGETADVFLAAGAGARLDILVRKSKGSEASGQITSVRGPTGPLAFSQLLKTSKKKQVINKLVLPAAGLYTVSVTNVGDAGELDIRAKLRKPKNPGVAHEGVDPQVMTALDSFYDQVGGPQAAVAQLSQQMLAIFEASDDPVAAGRAIRSAEILSWNSVKALQAAVQASLAGSRVVTIPKPVVSSTGFLGAPGVECDTGTTIFYINGVLNTKPAAIASCMQLAASLFAAHPDLFSAVTVRLFFNPTGLTDQTLQAVCGVTLEDDAIEGAGEGWFDAFVDAVSDFISETFTGVCNGVLSNVPGVIADLLLESPTQFVQQFLTPDTDAGLAAEFRDTIRQELNSGQTVIVVAHSQGNFYAQEALAMLTPEERESVGVVGVASPSFYPGSGSYGFHRTETLTHDIILLVPGAPTSNLDNALSLNSICPFTLGIPALEAICLYQRYLIHGFTDSYLAKPFSRAALVSDIVQAQAVLDNNGPALGQGFLQATLNWDIAGDMDLHVFEPTGAHVYYADKLGDIGELDFDDIPGDGPENYYVCTQDQMVPGDYDVYVNNYNAQTGTLATVSVNAGDLFGSYQEVALAPNGGSTLQPVIRVRYSVDGTFSLLPLSGLPALPVAGFVTLK